MGTKRGAVALVPKASNIKKPIVKLVKPISTPTKRISPRRLA